jgi:hypothetical protein
VSGSVLADDRRASEHFLRSERFGENLPRLTELASRYGSNLRRLHAAGRFRHNGHVTNLVWAGPGAPVIFTDLDSCMRCVDVSPERWKMERLRDAASGVFNFAIAAIDPRFQIVDELEPGSFQSIATELVAAYAGQTVNGSFEDIDDHVHRRGVAVRSELGGCQESPPALRGTGYALDRLWLTCRAMEVVNRLLLDGDDHGLAVDPRSLARSIETAHPGPACR